MMKSVVVKEILWLPPADNVVKLNVDRSSFVNPGKSGFGGLFRNNHGEWLLGFAGCCGFSTIMHAELAIYHGLTLAQAAGYDDVVCESDSTVALSLINEGTHDYHPYASIVNKIRGLCVHSWRLSFRHTLQEGNFCADYLAKFGANHDSPLIYWQACPPQMDYLLLADAMGFVRLR